MVITGENQDQLRKKIIPGAPSESAAFRIQDYWIDFWGALLPGVLFSIAAISSLLPTFSLIVKIFSFEIDESFTQTVIHFLIFSKDTPNTIWLAIAIALIALGHVLGHMFYRQDPKLPNQQSFSTVSKKMTRALNKPKPDEIELMYKKDLACTSKEDCEFPFPYLQTYLEKRGLDHLSSFVVWGIGKEPDLNRRTKNYINILKTKLRFYFPNRCNTIIRNEAHVRLSSSMWYVSNGMKMCSYFAAIGLLISAASSYYLFNKYPEIYGNKTLVSAALRLLSMHVEAFSALTVVWLIGAYVKSRVEKFLHYQRLREVVHVLETAYTAFFDQPELLDPPFGEYVDDVVQRRRKSNVRKAVYGSEVAWC